MLALFGKSTGQNHFELNDLKIDFHLENEMFNGHYKSYHENGQLKAEGEYRNNNRFGIWQVWDATGKLKIKRNYTSPYTYERILPKTAKQLPISLLSEFPYEIKRDSDSLYKYFPVQECEVVWLRKHITKIPVKNQLLLDTIIQLARDSSIVVYDTIDNSFSTKLNNSNLTNNQHSIDHYITISETFFDNTRYLMETRIIGICPVVITEKGPQKLFWIYLPHLRPHLKGIKVTSNNPMIKNFDDYLFLNEYPNTISSFTYYTKKGEKTDKYNNFPNKLNFEAIELEHDLWLKFHYGYK